MKKIIVSSYVYQNDPLRPGLKGPIIQVRDYCQRPFLKFNIIPLIIPISGLQCRHLDLIFEWIDGLCLLWGNDINPKNYWRKNESLGLHSSDHRDRVEKMLIKYCIKRWIPILGICRGMQMINVFFWWTLHQELQYWYNNHYLPKNSKHSVLISGEKLQRLFGKKVIETNSYHRQAIDELWVNLAVTARSEDNIIEAIEHTSLPIIGVQWHPEIDYSSNLYSEKFLKYLDWFFGK